MKARILHALTLIALVAPVASGQTITLNDFLTLVRTKHPFFEKERMAADIERRQQDRFLGEQDWIIRSSLFSAYQEPISTAAFFPERINSVGVGSGLNRAFWNTGGRLTLSWSTDFTDQDIPDIVIPGLVSLPAGPSQLYQNGVFVTYSQPLLQNFGGTLDRLDYELSDYTIDFTELQALENQEEFLLDLATRFLDWVLLSEQSQIVNDRLELAEEQLEQTKRKRAANLVDKVDVLRSEDAVRVGKQNVVLIESQWRAKQAELAVLAQSQELYNRGPEFDLYSLVTLPGLDEAVPRLREQSRVLQALHIRSEQFSHLREGFVDARRAQLFLNIRGGLQEGDRAFGTSLGLNKPDISLALDFRYPLGNRTAQANIEKTDLQLRQLEEETNSVALDLESAVRNLLIQIRELEKVLTLNQEQIESAREKTREELRLYNQGRG
ncbi:MAG: TolC family protein, partial [Bacteroidota bacterium]